MLNGFFRWWGRNLLDLLPRALRSGQRPGPDSIAVTLPAHGSAEFFLLRRGRETRIGSYDLDTGRPARALRRLGAARRRITLRLGAGLLLERDVVLPLAAEDDPAQVLRFELDRLTPFRSDEVVWTSTITARDPARRRLTVRLSLLPRAGFAEAAAVLARAGIVPAAVAAVAADGTWRRIPLGREPASGSRFDRVALRLAASLCAVAALAALATPFARQEIQLRQAAADIAALRPRVGEAETLRRAIAAARSGTDALARGAGSPGALEIIATLTAALPDDTFLTELTLREGRLAMRGQSANAARLIGLLSDEPGFRAVAFTAPLTRADTDAGDLFAVRAEFGR